jgi:twitching motility protein PilI
MTPGRAASPRSLRAFSDALAQRLSAAGAQVTRRLAIRIGTTAYLLALEDAGEIVPLPVVAAVPWTKRWFRGLANVRGRLVGVVDLADLSGEPPLSPELAPQLLVAGLRQQAPVGLLVTRAFGLRNVAELQPAAAAESGLPWRGARWRDAQGTEFFDLNLAGLLADERFTAIGV